MDEVGAASTKMGNATFKSTVASEMTNVVIRSAGESKEIKIDTW